MTAPKSEVIPVEYQNPHASSGLKLNLVVVSNTADEVLEKNIRENSAKYTDWLSAKEAHDTPVAIIAGGASINDHIDDIKELQSIGATVYALNGASKWARNHGIEVDYQVILDAKEETHTLVDPEANGHLFASQCDPKTLAAAPRVTLWHLASENVEDYLPPERVKRGGYVLIGGETTVGTCAMCVAYSQGYRDLHLFGFDSSHRDGKSHGFEQRINDTMPTTTVRWASKEYQVSIAMKRQALRFPLNAKALEILGCKLHLYGDGLLQTVYRTKFDELSEQEKYQTMWLYDAYRECSPGESIAEFYLNEFKPGKTIIDFGCGTGRASVIFAENGHSPILVDFADNCRDEEAMCLPFVLGDLTQEIPVKAKDGFCTDVMEHIPAEDTDKAIHNIMAAAENVFFQISTVQDVFGQAIGSPLHHVVEPHSWWVDKFQSLGYEVAWDHEIEVASLIYARVPDRTRAA